jgi:hypothetical protein
MATEKEIRDFLVSGQSQMKTMKIKHRGLTGSRNHVIYQLGRGMRPEDIHTPADQAAAQTRSEVEHDLNTTPGARRGYKRKASSRSSSQKGKRSSRSRSPKKKKKKTIKKKSKAKGKKGKSRSKGKKTRKTKTKKKKNKKRATPRAKLQTQPDTFTNFVK